MFNLARFSVQRPVAAGIVSVALLVLGAFYLSKMKVSLYPDVSFPFVNVSLPYPGASPEQIEATVVKPLETELASLGKLTRIISLARANGAQVILGFKMSANANESAEGVREKVNIVKGQFPTGVLEPSVRKVDLGAVPVLIFGVETQLDARKAKEYLDAGLVRDLQRVDGVSDVSVMGVGKDIFDYQLNAEKLLQAQSPPLDLFEQIKKLVTQVPWGSVLQDNALRNVDKKLPLDSTSHWTETSVALRDGRMVRLGDLGTFQKVPDENVASVYVNGHRGLGLVVTKRSDANTVETVHKVLAVMKANPSPDFNEKIKLFPIVNQAEYVEENAHEVWIALFVGGAFAILIILLFLTDLKSALISATALPVSILGSFIVMSWLGFTLNTMSLLALALAIGLLIDDAVVVRESIYAELESGVDPINAAIQGTDKVATAVLATTLSVIAVFLPVGAMSGMVGQFFKEFGLTICISVAISTWVAFTLDPLLSAHFAGMPRPFKGRFWDAWRRSLSQSEVLISRWALWSYDRWLRVIVLAVVMLVGSIALSASVGVDFLAFEDRGQFIVSVRLPAGTKREDAEKVALDVQERLKNLEGLKNSFAKIGGENEQNLVEVRLVFNAKIQRKQGLLALQGEARQRLVGLAGSWLVLDPPAIEGIGGETPVSVFLYGESIPEMLKEAEDLRSRIAAIPGIAGVRIDSDALSPTYEVNLNQQNVSFAGSDSQAIDLTGRLALTGLEPGTVGSENLKFRMRLREEDRVLPVLWNSLLVPSSKGPQNISLFAQALPISKPLSIDREKRSRKISLSGSMDRTRTFGEVLGAVEKEVKKVKAPFFAEVAGDKEVFEEMIESFAIAILGSLFFIFVILAAQFENLLRPFIILLSLPLAMIGGFVALYLCKMQLAMGALIGLILLIGLAAKNGILLVDAIGEHEKVMDLRSAVKRAVSERSRPIVMTSIAMIFGMIPTALMRGGGSEFRSPMAVAIMGGVVSSTLLSFLVIPAIFGLIQLIRNTKQRVSLPNAAILMLFVFSMFLVKSTANAQALVQSTPQSQIGIKLLAWHCNVQKKLRQAQGQRRAWLYSEAPEWSLVANGIGPD
jgi:hydrophobic/amphiphilic exporter-1 (mainly G- bacteria), HAE1 family